MIIEHVLAAVGIAMLVILAWGWVRYRQRRMSAEQRARIASHYRHRQPGWWAELDDVLEDKPREP